MSQISACLQRRGGGGKNEEMRKVDARKRERKIEGRKKRKEKRKEKKRKEKKKKKEKKVFSTGDSNVVTHHSTNPAHRCLTSEFRWDRVLSPGYDRRQAFLWWLSFCESKVVHRSEVLSITLLVQ